MKTLFLWISFLFFLSCNSQQKNNSTSSIDSSTVTNKRTSIIDSNSFNLYDWGISIHDSLFGNFEFRFYVDSSYSYADSIIIFNDSSNCKHELNIFSNLRLLPFVENVYITQVYPYSRRYLIRKSNFGVYDSIRATTIAYEDIEVSSFDLAADCKILLLSNINFYGYSTLWGNARSNVIVDCQFHDQLYCGIKCDSLVLAEVQFDSMCILNIPKYTFLRNLTSKAQIKLVPLLDSLDMPAPLSQVVLFEVDLKQLEFPDYGIDFIIDERQQYSTQERLYKQLIEYYKDAKDEREKYEIRLIKLINQHEDRWLTGWISEHWNYFGYNKNLVFRNSIILMLLCFFINLFIYPRILYNGYIVDELIAADQRTTDKFGASLKRTIWKFFYCFIYTAYIFWGIRLSIEKIRLSNIMLASWIIIQYVSGIICLAYIANIIISK